MENILIIVLFVAIITLIMVVKAKENNIKKIKLENKDELLKLKIKEEALTENMKLVEKQREQLSDDAKRLDQKGHDLEAKIDNKQTILDTRSQELLQAQLQLRSREDELEFEILNQRKKITMRLEEISGFTQTEAKELILEEQECFLKNDLLKSINKYKNKFDLEKKVYLENKILDTIQTIDVEQICETNARTIKLPSEEIKGRLIGKEGRNIKTLENLLGVNIIIDDTPKVIMVSTFDPVRRAIACDALDALVNSGKINQIYIEKQILKSELKIDDIIMQKATDALDLFGIDDIELGLVHKLGQLYFRSSLRQNVLGHSIECAKIAMKLAAELGLDQNIAARAGLLHDIGKVTSQQTGLSHVDLGVEIAKEFNESQEVIDAIAAHHGDCEPTSVYCVIITLADKLSAGRPGARTEGFENYVQRVKSLESIALNVKGVKKAYALQGAKELRMIVDADVVDDAQTQIIANKVKKQIEKELSFGGIIKINAFRELSIKTQATLVDRHKELSE